MKKSYFFVLPMMCVACIQAQNIGDKYVGAPYVLDPLGEEVAPDMDPLIRFDAFDCTTFVETVLSNGDVNKLNKIRYKDGQISFINRNHFIESDWLPNNADLVENISAHFGKTAIRTVTINRSEWLKRIHNITTEKSITTVNLEYLPYGNFATIKTEMPLVVLFIQGKSADTTRLGTDLAVLHMGFVLPNGMLRHASSAAGKVVDVNFDEYVAKRKKMANNIGVVLLKIKQK